MPWKEVSSMEQKHRFVILAEREEGLLGLEERTRRAHRYPHATDEALEALVLKVKRRHPTRGPKKLREVLITECKIEK